MNVYCVIEETKRISDPTKKKWLPYALYWTEEKAHAFRLHVLNDDGSDADLTNVGVTGEFYHNGVTIQPIQGSKSGNTAEVILEPACYATPGEFTFTMSLTSGN